MESSSLPNSFNSTEEHRTSILELNKKRKFTQNELGNSNLPWPKHRVVDQSDSSDHDPPLPEISNNGNSMGDIIDSLEVETENDSNISSNIGGSDNKATYQINSNTEALCSIDIAGLDSGMQVFSKKDSSMDDLKTENDDGEIEEEKTDDMVILASEGWSFKQGAREGSNKLTIDQEFEQYFAGLML